MLLNLLLLRWNRVITAPIDSQCRASERLMMSLQAADLNADSCAAVQQPASKPDTPLFASERLCTALSMYGEHVYSDSGC